MGENVEIDDGKKVNKEYEYLEPGTYPARCFAVIELGMHPSIHPHAREPFRAEQMISFEVSELMQDGRPFCVSLREIRALHKKAKLHGYLTSWLPWLGDFLSGETPCEEGPKTFELADLLDKTCMVSVNCKNGWNNVTVLLPLPKGMYVIERQNELIDYSMDMINLPVFDTLWPWVQNIIKKSLEGKRFFGENAEPTPPRNIAPNRNDLPFT